jgi:6-pyruvoyltetrahydropterin/6-carboxytetrahydropterin synthase
MLAVTKEFTFDCAHVLSYHEGLCKNLHGHTYKLQVEVGRTAWSPELPEMDGMVIDFKVLKMIVTSEIISRFDHAFIYWGEGADKFEVELATIIKKFDARIVELGFRPTAENMAEFFYKKLAASFAHVGIEMVAIRLWETPTSYAEVRNEIWSS